MSPRRGQGSRGLRFNRRLHPVARGVGGQGAAPIARRSAHRRRRGRAPNRRSVQSAGRHLPTRPQRPLGSPKVPIGDAQHEQPSWFKGSATNNSLRRGVATCCAAERVTASRSVARSSLSRRGTCSSASSGGVVAHDVHAVGDPSSGKAGVGGLSIGLVVDEQEGGVDGGALGLVGGGGVAVGQPAGLQVAARDIDGCRHLTRVRRGSTAVTVARVPLSRPRR
jgi:hypothetical protein